jgi:hypothetical protein
MFVPYYVENENGMVFTGNGTRDGRTWERDGIRLRGFPFVLVGSRFQPGSSRFHPGYILPGYGPTPLSTAQLAQHRYIVDK